MMSQNDQILLDQLLLDRKKEIAQDISEQDYFDLFCSEEILKDYDLTYDELNDGIVDEGGDGGIDAIYVFLNGELVQDDTEFNINQRNIDIHLVIIQAKTAKGFSEEAVHKLTASCRDLFDLSKELDGLKAVYNEQLLNIVGRFRNTFKSLISKSPKLFISYFYATKGIEVHPNTDRKVEGLKAAALNLFSNANFEFKFLGANDLLAL